jgi:SAM-dependent methyltransferase
MYTGRYIHGSDAAEQSRLADLNGIINERCLAEIRVGAGESIIDFGSGLGQMSVAMAGRAGPSGRVVGIERDERQLAGALRLIHDRGDGAPIEFRQGDVFAPPLRREEVGTFDLAHTRFVLEHVPEPGRVVEQMVRAVRPGGRVVLADDDHDVLRLWPVVPEFDAVWRAYVRSYEVMGNDPYVGRKLPALLHAAGARPVRSTSIFFGACAGNTEFPPLISNLVRVVDGAAGAMAEHGLLDGSSVRAGVRALEEWSGRPDASLWLIICLAEGIVP